MELDNIIWLQKSYMTFVEVVPHRRCTFRMPLVTFGHWYGKSAKKSKFGIVYISLVAQSEKKKKY